MAPLWTWDALIAATGGMPDSVPASEITGVSIDTRTLRPGDLFVALKDVRDGHEFVTAAFKAGAVAALVSRDYGRQPGDGALLRVDDPLRALRRIGIAARERLRPEARIVAVTGSAGKTGTKEMLRVCLEAVDPRTHASEKSYNNHWGVPLTLARMPAHTRYAVFEIGMNHAGEITPLSQMARPHIAIITNVLPVHLGHFANVEAIADAKAEIFAGLVAPRESTDSEQSADNSPVASRLCVPGDGEAVIGDLRQPVRTPDLRADGAPSGDAGRGSQMSGGTAILLRDSPYFVQLSKAAQARGARVVTFGRDAQSDLRLSSRAASFSLRSNTMSVAARSHGEAMDIEYHLGMIGRHLALNSLAVVQTLCELGCDLKVALQPLAKLSPPVGRGARTLLSLEGGPAVLIDESYNANPASMAAAITTLYELQDDAIQRRIVVLGDMLELGPASADLHKKVLEDIFGRMFGMGSIDLMFACGPMFQKAMAEFDPVDTWIGKPTSADLRESLLAAIRPGDIIMIKGSLGSRMGLLVDALKSHFRPAG